MVASPMVRSNIRVVMAILQPSPSSPTRISTGTRTSSMNTSLNSGCPVICLMGLTSTPGSFMSRRR